MQGVNARIAPVAIEVVTVAGRPGTAEFKQAAGGVKGNLGGEHFGAGNGDGSLRHMLLAEILFKAVENLARLLQQRLSGGQSAVDLPDMVDGERIVAGPFDAGINPRSGELANEADGVVEGCAGDPGINRGGGELREGAGERRRGIRFPRREKMQRRDRQILRQDRAAGGISLPKAVPVIEHRQASAVARHEGQLRAIVGVQRQNAYPVGVERAGAIALPSVDVQRFTTGLQAGADIEHRFAAGLGKRVGKTMPL